MIVNAFTCIIYPAHVISFAHLCDRQNDSTDPLQQTLIKYAESPLKLNLGKNETICIACRTQRTDTLLGMSITVKGIFACRIYLAYVTNNLHTKMFAQILLDKHSLITPNPHRNYFLGKTRLLMVTRARFEPHSTDDRRDCGQQDNQISFIPTKV